jgi:hypothetical protein
MEPGGQRILIVADGRLNFSTGPFGLSRCIAALLDHSPRPLITLAHRTERPEPGEAARTVARIAGVDLVLFREFSFHDAAPAVTIGNYDQIWLFGILQGEPAQALSSDEVATLCAFMNAGGGVFATGDHLNLGRAMGGELPRIRHMRDWSSIPMGAEGRPRAYDPRNRIDTVIDPGANGLYQFDDQSDAVPQRIYPNYEVQWPERDRERFNWTAKIHPLLSLGEAATRNDSTGFTNDMDVLPDHAHESVCLEVSPTANAEALNGRYTLHGQDFDEFPSSADGVGRVGSTIVAYAVSGGRSVAQGAPWKPPVYPRMFGVISAFDGHSAQPYSGINRPGRIVCDSTWHHFVNINIDGTGNSEDFGGLGKWVGDVWTPSADCLKIFEYYRNILKYLAPPEQQGRWLYYELLAIRFHPQMIEELMTLPAQDDAPAIENLGLAAIALLDRSHGRGTAVEAVRSALRLDASAHPLADLREGVLSGGDGLGRADWLAAYSLGKTLVDLAQEYSVDEPERFSHAMSVEQAPREKAAMRSLASAAVESVRLQALNLTERLERLSALSKRLA